MANILITGGSRGIGAANVRRLAREGHRVCFVYKESIETAHSLTRVLQAEGCDVIGVQCDVRQPSQVQKVVDTMNNNWGGVDVLINGAGISWTGLLQDMLDAEWLHLGQPSRQLRSRLQRHQGRCRCVHALPCAGSRL